MSRGPDEYDPWVVVRNEERRHSKAASFAEVEEEAPGPWSAKIMGS